jgi:hypothetical protein
VAGYNAITEELVGNWVYDFMSYCDPNWISDYHFARLDERSQAVNSHSKGSAGQGRPWRTLVMGPTGEVTDGPVLHPLFPPEGRPVAVELLDGAGEVVEEVEGVFRPFSDPGGGVVLFPEPVGFGGTARIAADHL